MNRSASPNVGNETNEDVPPGAPPRGGAGVSDAPTVRVNGRAARRSTAWERRLLETLLHRSGDPPVRFLLWDGTEVAIGDESDVQLELRTPRALRKLVVDPLYQFGDLYSTGELSISEPLEGGLITIFDALRRAGSDAEQALEQRWRKRLYRPRSNTLSGSRQNIHSHYDLGNDFYRLWLDERMLYTCAYFARPQMTLEEAQLAKMDYVGRKVWLQPGETVVEAGCGWGALAMHLARRFGVKVKAYNISHEQILYARHRAAREGLSDLVEFVEDDWRTIRGRYDAFVSVGMLEHVGLDNYNELGRVIRRSLTPNGRGLIHSIGQAQSKPLNRWIERRIFPGARPPAVREMMDIFEPAGLRVLDLENLRLHYAETLRHWLDRFRRTEATVEQMFDEQFVRLWRFYLATSMAAFVTDGLQLFQVVFANEGSNAVPRNRAHHGSADPATVTTTEGVRWTSFE